MATKSPSFSSRRKRKHIDVEYEEKAEKKDAAKTQIAQELKREEAQDEQVRAQIKKEMKEEKSVAVKQEKEVAEDAKALNNSKKMITGKPLVQSKLFELKQDISKQISKHPPNQIQFWLNQLEKIRKFRYETRNAPVDTMGAEELPIGDEKTFRFQTLVSLMLSSQTRDQVTGAAMKNLQTLPGGLTAATLLKASDETIGSMIRQTSFYIRKIDYLKRTAAICVEKYGGDIPQNMEGLLELPGVGPKMSYLTMLIAWKNCVGIGVDVHVHRISNRLGWVKNTKGPEQTRMELEEWLPRNHWTDINLLLVGFGQVQCLPVGPKCGTCVVNDTCPTGIMNLKKIEKDSKSKKQKI